MPVETGIQKGRMSCPLNQNTEFRHEPKLFSAANIIWSTVHGVSVTDKYAEEIVPSVRGAFASLFDKEVLPGGEKGRGAGR